MLFRHTPPSAVKSVYMFGCSSLLTIFGSPLQPHTLTHSSAVPSLHDWDSTQEPDDSPPPSSSSSSFRFCGGSSGNQKQRHSFWTDGWREYCSLQVTMCSQSDTESELCLAAESPYRSGLMSPSVGCIHPSKKLKE